ncbi:hypothetical protein [Chitinophaga sp. Cy-1792]|uniref:hypothetical protein n=1 Tax=Chitinophaga sp. Cy-1792 TaxID=2608339 RepID=UPI00141EEF26|nr:hypothetical protein [Chitinophaga sp. Cy-1792]NIG54605.1 hypothetical protein [Chitinophaga sp. Cy-1792]
MQKKLHDFIREHVLGKVMQTPALSYDLEKGGLRGIYSDRMLFSDLSETEDGIQFHMTTVTTEKVYEVSPDGSEGLLQKDFTGTSVYRYELAIRKSSGEMTGFMHLLSSTVAGHTMEAVVYGVYNIFVSEDEVSWREEQLLYRDMPAGDGRYRAVAFDATARWYLEKGKLRFEYIPSYYDYNPETRTRKLSADKYPPFVSKEL